MYRGVHVSGQMDMILKNLKQFIEAVVHKQGSQQIAMSLPFRESCSFENE